MLHCNVVSDSLSIRRLKVADRAAKCHPGGLRMLGDQVAMVTADNLRPKAALETNVDFLLDQDINLVVQFILLLAQILLEKKIDTFCSLEI